MTDPRVCQDCGVALRYDFTGYQVGTIAPLCGPCYRQRVEGPPAFDATVRVRVWREPQNRGWLVTEAVGRLFTFTASDPQLEALGITPPSPPWEDPTGSGLTEDEARRMAGDHICCTRSMCPWSAVADRLRSALAARS